jgi:cyclic-di-AMP phosphodiesterase PgpH
MSSRLLGDSAAEVPGSAGSTTAAPGDGGSRADWPQDSPLRQALRAILLALFLWVSWSALYIFHTSTEHVAVQVGDVSPRNIRAPRQIIYVSELKTREARELAAARIPDVYVGPEMQIARQQINRLYRAIQDIEDILADTSLGREAKAERLQTLPDLALSESVITSILNMELTEWQGAAYEATRVLDIVMREEIRPNQVADARRRVQRLTTYALTDDQRLVIHALSQEMIAANTFFDAEQTASRRQEARDAIQPVSWTIRQGESILREGEIVTALAYEKLQVLDLLDTDLNIQEAIGTALLFLVIVMVIAVYIVRGHPLLLGRPRRLLLVVLTLFTVVAMAHLTIPGRTLVPYLFPAAAAVMVVAVLVDVQLAMLVAVISAFTVGYTAGGSLELTLYVLASSVVGGWVLWRMENLGAFVRSALYMSLTHIAIILAFRLQTFDVDAVGLLQLIAAGVSNAILSASLTFVAYAFIGRIFGIATSLQLFELARPTHPLFRQLLIEAPGTYHHSIVVSNMAERAAEAIGADALLARVGSYYHDIGKTLQPYFFAENQSDGVNPHDDLDPTTSAEIILAHPREGLRLARKYRLPDRVCAFIPEHHGTTLQTYFYQRASQESEEDVNEDDFCYPGPKPQTKETAIVMLADSIEAWVRANRPSSQAEMERVIRRVINDRLVSGQLDECDLTLKDLDAIRLAFISVLQGIFHPRVQYPERSERRTPRQNSDSAPQPAGNGSATTSAAKPGEVSAS